MDHPKAEMGIKEIEIVRNGPHEDQMDVLLAQFPGYHSRGSGDRIEIIDCDDDFSVGREHFSLVETELKVPIMGVDHGKAEHPAGPVLNTDDAPHLMACIVLLNIT